MLLKNLKMTEIKFAGKKDIVPIYETETLSFYQPLSKNEIENIINNKSYTVIIIKKQNKILINKKKKKK